MSTRKYQSDVNFIQALSELLRSNDLTEIEVIREFGENDSLNVRVARQMAAAPAQVVQAAAPAPAAAPAQAAAPAPAAAPADTGGDPADHPGAVTSPMVGTAYLQPEPGSPAFIKVGDQIEEGQTLLIIEAMKTMNQIPAPRGGKVARILVEDGSPVEFGAPLVILE
ncbi:acetyl-CoA carboxylase biotin carboxyl carrier protein [Oceanomicrobium pacificus]|uniref:Biotin carboxyl carrier protein of acetyl-CoA carboxylase n=1 Tax=Oceanomicrobium pacificus TaxID=2692916 RepID=A0A6B0TWY5_9RHOB|nr:acetyl-CoA carboxylase biotin carboxyl carrier protein [Oceanomicrobium pacificus]MXU65792.1 acetyl-CoA carboxylase biotin carboxyl carrier protein [Oceanomicrobium pacificus]